MSNLLEYARDEMRRAGLYDKDADYGGEIPHCVEKMVEAFSSYGHSGGSAEMTLTIFDRVARFRPLSAVTSDPSEWVDVSEASGGHPMWQNRRNSSVFSKDGGQTWYDIDAPKTES